MGEAGLMPARFTIGFPYVADRFGGSTASSLVLAQALREAGHGVHILTHGAGGRVTQEAVSLDLPVTRLPPLSDTPSYSRPDRFRLEHLLAFRDARAAIARLGLDIVHANDITILRSWAAPSLAGRAALIAHWRSNYRESWSVKTGLRIAARVIAISRYSFGQLPGWVREKAVVEYNAFAPPAPGWRQAASGIRQSLGIPADAALVGVFGNLITRKRTHVLADVLKAVSRTADGRPVFGIACGGRAEPYDHELDRKIAAYGLEHRLLRPGFVRPVESWMGACDAVLAPAACEPFGRTVIEAQAVGVPVAVSSDAGVCELVGNTALVCGPQDIDGWITATRRLLDDRGLVAAMTAAARDLTARLAPAQHAARVGRIYQDLLATGKAA
jgi:glycosyltransferase involved in cell wall biosynthesis